ncbi:Mitogen-activated protein kinase-like NTF3, partial [Cucurbita argyrosperma subsp. sororia]
MATEEDLDLSTLKTQLSETNGNWKHEMERRQSKVDVLQARLVEVKASIEGSEEDSRKELEVLWRRVTTTSTLLTYLKSKAKMLAVPHLAHSSCGIKHLEGVGFVDKSGTPLSGWSKSIDLSSFDGCEEESLMVIGKPCGLLDEQDAAYIGQILKSVQIVSAVMEALVKRVILAESEAAEEKEKVHLGQEEIKKKSIQIENMSSKLEEMEQFAVGTNGILNEMRLRVEDLVEETCRQRQRAAENEQELCHVKQDFESLKSYVSSLITVRETLLSSEKQFQTIERLFERLVAKTSQLEGEKMQKEVEVQKLMEENSRNSSSLLISQPSNASSRFTIPGQPRCRQHQFDSNYNADILLSRNMATPVQPPKGFQSTGKHYYSMCQTLFEIDTKYVPIKPIGRGSYGVVCSSTNQQTNEKVAIKKIKNVFENRFEALRTLREMKLLRHIRHENVIALKDVMMPVHRNSFKDVYLVYELMNTDLDHIIRSSQPLSNNHCKCLMYQLLSGLQYLHSTNILHRDLKPGNLLVNANCDLKICDFGLARTSKGQDQAMTEYIVTRWYRAPELLLSCKSYGTSIDVWSVGCIFAEILGRTPIFPGTNCLNQLELIIEVLGSPKEADIEFIDNLKSIQFVKAMPYSKGVQFSDQYPQAETLALDLLQKMLVFDPRKRITVNEALQHPYMSELYDTRFNPTDEVPLSLNIDESLDEHEIREMILTEMLHYHPETATT